MAWAQSIDIREIAWWVLPLFVIALGGGAAATVRWIVNSHRPGPVAAEHSKMHP